MKKIVKVKLSEARNRAGQTKWDVLKKSITANSNKIVAATRNRRNK